MAEPFHAPTIDGIITGDDTDWAPADLVVIDSHDEDPVQAINVRRLWCTWDADNLYIGITYQDFADFASLTVFLDLDRGIGPNNASDLDTYAGQFLMPEDHRIELLLGRSPADGGNDLGLTPVPRLVTDADGTTIDLSSEITVAQGRSVEQPGPDKNPFIFWFNAEYALPWASIYPDAEGTVPANAVIKAVAVITSGDPDKNGIDSAPDNDGLDQGETPVTFHNLHASVIDANGDGEPDPCDATISGLLNLPNHDGQRVLEVSAHLTDYAGRDPVAALSSFTGAAGDTTFTLPRLPAGDYELTFSSEGYQSATTSATVSESQQLTGVEMTLTKAASISGEISYEIGVGGAGTVTLSSNTGTFIDSIDFSATGGPFTFYLEKGGSFRLDVEAQHYMNDRLEVTVGDGQDLTGVDFELIRQTRISGLVAFAEASTRGGTVHFLNVSGDTLDQSDFSSVGGDFEFFTPVGGQFTVSAKAPEFARTDSTFFVTSSVDVPDISLVMPHSALITTEFSFEGPEVEGLLVITNVDTGFEDDPGTTFTTNGPPYSRYLDPGNYNFSVSGLGYVPEEPIITVGLEDIDLGL